jgi:hypothetical protein
LELESQKGNPGSQYCSVIVLAWVREEARTGLIEWTARNGREFVDRQLPSIVN